MKPFIMYSGVVVFCLLVLAGCIRAPSVPELVLRITVVGRTDTHANLDVSLRNESRHVFYPTKVTIKWCDVAGFCRTEHLAPYHWTESIPPWVTRSELETIPIIYPGFYRVAWFEVIIEGRYSNERPVSTSSGRVIL